MSGWRVISGEVVGQIYYALAFLLLVYLVLMVNMKAGTRRS